MPDPKKPWEKNYSEDIAETKVEAKKPWEQDYVSDSEKKNSIATSTPPKSVSVTSTGSSDGVNSKMKTFNGLSNTELKKINSQDKPLPTINQNIKNKIKEKSLRNELKNTKVTPENMESISLKTDSLSKITKENQEADAIYERNKKDDYSFLDYSKDTAISGVGTFYKSIADTPELLYDVATQTFINPRLEAEGSPFLLKTGDEIADDLGLKNIPADILQVQIKEANERIKSYSDKNGVDPLKAIQDGNYSGAAKLIAGTTIQSAPLMIAAILSGGSSLGLTAVGVSSAATQNSDLKSEHPEMNVNTRIKNAVATGVIEATVGSIFTGASGAVAKRIIADKGVEVGSKLIAKSFRGSLEKVITKNPIVGALGEVAEEMIVEGSHQTKDIISGIRADYDLHAIGNAGVSSTGMGAVNTIAVYGAKGYVKAKTYAKLKSTNKEIFKLRSEIDNGNLSPENKAILGLRADRLEAENKKLLGTEIEKVKALPSDVKTELNALNEEFESLKSKFDDIDDADDIPDNLKPAMKEEIKIQAAKNQKRKTEILSQNDGLEVDNDFSNFDGVEPDFNLENGKISSLPLKEQDRLNNQALQELTGGDMSIEVTKEQVSQKVNEIYTNEQTPPTSETKPQAEVPQQAEAEKVAELRDSTEISQNQEVADVEKRREDEKKNLDSDLLNYNEGESSIIGQGLKEIRDDIVNAERKGLISYKDKQLAQAKMNLWLGAGMSLQEVAEKIKEQFGINVSGGKWTLKEIKLQQINAKYDAELEALKTKETPKPQEVSPVEDVVATSVEKPLSLQEENVSMDNNLRKEKQLEIINKSNPAPNSYNTWVRTTDDIKEAKDVFETAFNDGEMYPDFTVDNMQEALDSGEVTIYSSQPIKNGIFVTPSKMNAEEYAGGRGGKIYSKKIKINDVAWIDESEGQYAPVKETKNAKPSKTNTPTNGNVQLGASNVGESGNAKPKSNSKSSVPSSVDGGEVKGDASVGKIIEPHSEVNTDVETVKKELKLNEVESLIYDSFKDISKDETVDKVDDIVEKWKDNKFGEIEAIESKINDIDIKLEDNGIEIDQINDAENMTAAKKKKAVAAKEKEYDDLQKQQKELEEQKEAVNESLKQIDDVLFHPTEDYNIDLINEVVDKVNNRLETRKSIKEGTNLFPEDANVPEFVAIKKELIKLTDEKTIADFNSRTAEQVKESEPIIADIKSKAKNAERISKEELEKGIDDAEKIIAEAKNGAEELERLSAKNVKDLEDKSKNNTTQVPEGKGSWRKAFNEEKDAFKKSAILRRIAEKTTSESDLLDIKEASKGMPEESNIINEVNNKLKSVKPTTKERIAERIKLSDAKIDENSDVVKAKIKAFMDMFPSADINPDDYHTNGFSADAIIDMVAKAAKAIAKGGIVTSEHIKEAIKAYNTHFDDEIDPKLVEERINPKKEADKADKDFKSKSGKKSLLGRLIEGGNPDVITKAVKELGENYDVRNQQEANDEAMAFIDKVGASEALKAIKDGLITNSDVKMLIYDEALTRLKTEISDEINNNPEDREALIQKFQEVSDDFDKAIRDAGQGIAIMNYIYNKNQTLKYNLKKQISDWKRNDPNGEIPADVKAKFEELEQKLKDVEERTKVAEERAKKAEDDLAIKNIKEDVERKNQASKKNKSGLTPQEQNRKKELRNKFARANDVTGIPALLVDPEFREYLGLVLKTAKGDFSNFSNEILKELGKSARQHLPELFANAGGKGDVKVTDLQSITINEEGKIKIPAQMLRDYVEQGYTDIDEIAALIKDDIADEFPDADVRDIRDALTGYGKQINPNKDEITAEVNKLKEYGRLLSAYDDVMNGQMPLKSGLKRPKSEQKARELRRNINRLAKELNLEPIDLEKQWANAIDKVKSHLKNQIEDLDKQIANGEKRKVERTSIKLDEEATALKTIRDAKKQILDDLVGKPELTEEQKIASAEKSLETSIKKIQEEIDTNDISFKEKPTPATSKKIEELRTAKKALLETKKQLRQEAGLIEQQRLKTAKTRIKNQIEDLNTKIKNKDFAKKEIKPILADNELNTLRAEKEAIYEEYEKMKYLQELKNRSRAKKIMDEGLEALGLARAVKASLDLGLIGIQLRGFTYSELWRNPKELGRKFIKLFGAIGSQNKTNKAMSELIGHPLHALAKKLDIGMTHPDLRNEVREEMASGNLLHFIWSSPVLAIESLGGKQFVNSKRSSVGDSFINSVKSRYNKLFKNYQVDIKQKEKFSIKEQWKNINAFEAVERGLSIYGNQLRFEEFVRGVERLKAEGKDEINHLEDYKALASYIRTFSGRAKPMGFELNQKSLNVFFFSFKNMASVIQQLNPIYYMIQHGRSTDFKNGNYFKPSVANKMAMATMFKSVVSTSATLLFVMAAYNAFKDDDEEEATIEKDPRSSDFGKLKIGNFRYDPWGGYIPLISLYARLATEEVKKSDGSIYKFGKERNGIEDRGHATAKFLFNKESPGFQMFHQYMTSVEGKDELTGETRRETHYGGALSEEDAYSFYPIFLGSIKSAKEKDYEGIQAFLTAYSILGLGNVQEYESKKGNTPEQKFIKDQAKKKALFELSDMEKDKIRVDDKLTRVESKIKMLQEIKIAQQQKLPYYISKDVALTKEEVAEIDLTGSDESIAETMKIIKQKKKEYKIDEEE